jgi:Activator of Hsp90 ATPase homolog 1-like protein
MRSAHRRGIAMSDSLLVTVVVEVSVNPATAFQIFTAELDSWWRPGPINWYDVYRAVSTRFEPGVGGRWLEVYDEESEEAKEIARITVWEPGSRLAFKYCDGDIDGTEVEVRFDSVGERTRVTLEHRGWEKLGADKASRKMPLKQAGWTNILSWYTEWADWSSPLRIRGRSAEGLEFIRIRRRQFEASFGG